MDLFSEIENAYSGKASIFDNFKKEDIIMAFFPCVRFENMIMLHFRGQHYSMKNWSYKKKMKYCMKLLSELKHNYDLVNKLFIVCMDKGLKLIMENPYSEEHFLRRYWCYPPSIIDKDRRENGDYFKKPTQYWFLNCEPKNNLAFEPIEYVAVDIKNPITRMDKKVIESLGAKNITQARSMIHPQYANRFIRQYILDSNGNI